MGLSEETNGHPQVSKFIQKINKAKLMTFLIRVNAASTRIQGAFKKSQKRKRFQELLKSFEQAGAQNPYLDLAMSHLGINPSKNNNSRKC